MSAEKKSTDSASPAKRITLLSIMIIQLGVVIYTGSGISCGFSGSASR